MRTDLPSSTPFDAGVLDFVVGHRTGFLTTVCEGLSQLGSTMTLTVIVVVAGALFAACRLWRSAAMVWLGSVTGYWLMIVLKGAIARDRPPEELRLVHAAHHSMPSGHAMMSAIVFGLIAVGLFRSSAWIREHPDVLLVAPVMSFLIGLSRVYLGVHWLTDVLVGWAIGAVWIAVVATIARLGATPSPLAPSSSRAGLPRAEPRRSTSR